MKLRRLIHFNLFLFGFIFIHACGDKNKSKQIPQMQESEDLSQLTQVITNTNDSDIKIGSGFNSLTNDVLDRCMIYEGEKDLSLPADLMVQTSSFTLKKIESYEELRSGLSVSASAAFNAGYSKYSAQANYLKNLQMSAFSSYMIIDVITRNQIQSLSRFVLTDEAKDVLLRDEDAFLDTCGDSFISGKITGGRFTAVVEFFNQTKDEKEQMDASLRASGGSWKLASDFQKSIEALSQTGQVNVTIFKEGGSGNLPSIKDLIDTALNFPSLVTQSSQPWVISWVSKPYKNILSVRGIKKPIDLMQQELFLEDASKIVQDAKFMKNNIRYTLSNTSSFDIKNDEIQKLQKADAELSQIINIYQLQASKCFANPKSDCLWPAISFPAVQMPQWVAAIDLLSKKCEARRLMAKIRNLVEDFSYRFYERKNFVPIFHDIDAPEQGIYAWAECHSSLFE